LAIVVSSAAWCLGAREDARWHLDPGQYSAWLATVSENPSQAPSAAIKVAVAPVVAVTGVEILEPVWRDEPWGGPAPVQAPVARLGIRSSWHGVPFQEILISPVQPSATPDRVRILESCSLRLLPGTEVEPAVIPRLVPNTGDLAAFANPLRAAELKASQAQERRVSPTQAPEAVAPRARISVSQDGIYRMTYAYLVAQGIDPSSWTASNVHMASRGVEVPILVEGPAGGTFGSSNAIVFYGQELSITNRPVWNGGDFTDTNVYWLYADSTPGLRMADVGAAPVSGYATAPSFTSKLHFESNDILDSYDHFRPNGDEWFWLPYLSAPNGSPGPAVTHAVTLPHPAASGFSVTAVLAGLRSFTHGVSIQVNGVSPSSGGSPATWTGKTLGTLNWTFSGALPSSGPSSVALTLAGVPGQTDYAYLDYVELAYERAYTADDNALLMTPPNADATYQCSPFSSAPYILDVSREDSATGLAFPRNLTGAAYDAGLQTSSFQMAADGGVSGRSVCVSSAPRSPDAAAMSSGIDLSSTWLGCDLLIITHPDFHPAGGDAVWQQYLTRRQSSMSVTVVDVQDVFDNFSYGIFDPTSLQTFLGQAAAHWAHVPKYVLLIGDGTYDYKNGMHVSGARNRVPTMMFDDVDDSTYLGRYPSDAWFAGVDGSGFPEMAVGRIPAHSYAELAGVLTKLMAYEDQVLSGTWYKTQLYIADTYTYSWEQEFEIFNNSLIASYGSPPWAYQQLYYHSSPYNGTDSTAFSSAIKAAWPNSALIHYDGHSGFSFWGYHSFFGTADVSLLPAITLPSAPLPFVVNASCYNSAFDEVSTTRPLMEAMILRADGGSVGSTGFSTISYPSDEEAFNGAIYALIFGTSKSRVLGDAVEVGRFALPSTDARDVMGNILLGDPSLSLRLPAPPPPATLFASGGNASVSLSWGAASPVPASYNAYRSADGGLSWVKANTSPIPPTPTTYLDTGLTNGQTYYYYVTSVDASGFEGAPGPTASATPSLAALSVSAISPNIGPLAGAQLVTITGTGFLNGATVSIGGSLATSVAVGPSTSITCLTPAHAAGTVDVVVTNPDAQSGRLPNGYTYSDAAPAPTVTTISPTSGPISGGTSVTVSGTAFQAGATIDFGGTPGTSVTLISSTVLTCLTPSHAAGSVDVTVTNSDHQVGTLSNGFVFAAAPCTLTCTATAPATGQAGTPLSFHGSATPSNCIGQPAFQWAFGDGNSSNEQNPSHAYDSAGTFSWSMTATLQGTSCSEYGSLTVTPAVPLPIITGITKAGDPFRLKVSGGNFHTGCTIKVNGAPVPTTTYKSGALVVAKKGAFLKAMFPAGVPVQITVTNNDDGGVSAPVTFVR